MSKEKKLQRARFRNAVFKRDNYTCRKCNRPCDLDELDAHHITDRNDMPNGGYALENGISLCGDCHLKAEMVLNDGTGWPGYSPQELYDVIGSSIEMAIKASKKLR
jgi:5-methylcytosine-specific restriction endonuclease McrA